MPKDGTAELMRRSAQDWAEAAAGPLMRLRAEVWEALDQVRDHQSGKRSALSYADIVELWRPSEQDYRVVEARWRRGILDASKAGKLTIDVMDIGEVLEALDILRDRLPEGKASRVRRLLHSEPDPPVRLFEKLYPGGVAEQDVSGLLGAWRLVHTRSTGTDYVVWHVSIERALEPKDGPGAWFTMNTRIPANFVRSGRREEIPKTATGAAHAVGAAFYLMGADCERRPVTASFVLNGGTLPKDNFDMAHGIIQRMGNRGIYAAHALLRRVDPSDNVVVGTFTEAEVTEQGLNDLSDDFATLAAAGSTHFLLASDGFDNG